MRKQISIVLITVILLTNVCTLAEQNEGKDIFGTIGGFINETINNAGATIDNAANDVTGFINDAGENISGALDNAGNSIAEFWNKTSGYASDAWNWAGTVVEDTGNAISDSTQHTLNQLGSWLDITGDNALSTLKDIFDVVTSSLGIAGSQAAKIWDSVYQYSIEKNINMVVLVKLTLAILIRISLGSDILIGEMAGDYIDEVVMDWFSDFNINSQEDAENALTTLENSLESAVSGSNN